MKLHCFRRWRETSKPSRSGGAMKEGESGRAWSRAVLGGLGILLEERRVYRDGNWREVGGRQVKW